MANGELWGKDMVRTLCRFPLLKEQGTHRWNFSSSCSIDAAVDCAYVSLGLTSSASTFLLRYFNTGNLQRKCSSYHGHGGPQGGVVFARVNADVPAGLQYVDDRLHADIEL